VCQVQERERIRREEQEYVRQKYVVFVLQWSIEISDNNNDGDDDELMMIFRKLFSMLSAAVSTNTAGR